jgi:hypothetical protein
MINVCLLEISGSVEENEHINIYSMACYAVMAIPHKEKINLK